MPHVGIKYLYISLTDSFGVSLDLAASRQLHDLGDLIPTSNLIDPKCGVIVLWQKDYRVDVG